MTFNGSMCVLNDTPDTTAGSMVASSPGGQPKSAASMSSTWSGLKLLMTPVKHSGAVPPRKYAETLRGIPEALYQ